MLTQREWLKPSSVAYVERPVAQVARRLLNEGSRPAIYGLTRKGARLLHDEPTLFKID
ncbi:MAG TPA: hypothetical protein VGH02_01265 [Rhizomicrobium sp.]